tara:strand:- start:77 stop:643 length:567 start_codon:yes stop_codon:yes gene_type:complete
MANKKKPYNWSRVKPGDVISFRYKSEKTGALRTHSILVLNPRITIVNKDKSQSRKLIGIKLEESNMIDFRLTTRQIQIMEQIGNFKKIDDKNNLFKLNIHQKFLINDIKGVKKRAYELLKKSTKMLGQYRTYSYSKAKRSGVFLEPIRVFDEKYKKQKPKKKKIGVKEKAAIAAAADVVKKIKNKGKK